MTRLFLIVGKNPGSLEWRDVLCRELVSFGHGREYMPIFRGFKILYRTIPRMRREKAMFLHRRKGKASEVWREHGRHRLNNFFDAIFSR
jgi:hypothetical protein